jgi:hypothetical protein
MTEPEISALTIENPTVHCMLSYFSPVHILNYSQNIHFNNISMFSSPVDAFPQSMYLFHNSSYLHAQSNTLALYLIL